MSSTHPIDAPSVAPVLATGGGDGDHREVISTVELTKIYPGMEVAAVDKLNLSVRAGEIFGLLGPNGAGKTTTAGMLTTRVIPTSGAAFVGAIDVIAQPALAKQLIGIVSQQNTLDRQLTVWENLYFHGRLFGISAADSRRIADELLEKLHLSKWAKASVYALSGGMAQRLMMARAIFHRPAVLFLDEPTAGLDPQARREFHDLAGRLTKKDQTTILLTTHDLGEAEKLADRILIINRGQVIADGTAEELAQRIADHDEVRWTRGGQQFARSTAESTEFVFGLFKQYGEAIADLEIRRSSLEDTYLALVHEAE